MWWETFLNFFKALPLRKLRRHDVFNLLFDFLLLFFIVMYWTRGKGSSGDNFLFAVGGFVVICGCAAVCLLFKRK